MTSSAKKQLNDKQQAFAREYLLDSNAQQAAIRAGYSKATARQQASRLLSNVNVMNEIKRLQGARNERTDTHADWVLERLKEEAEADIADIFQDNGTLKPISQWPMIWRQGLVAGIKTQELFAGSGGDRVKIGDAVEVKISDRIKRLELIGKHIDVGAFREKVEHDAAGELRRFMEAVSGSAIRPQGG